MITAEQHPVGRAARRAGDGADREDQRDRRPPPPPSRRRPSSPTNASGRSGVRASCRPQPIVCSIAAVPATVVVAVTAAYVAIEVMTYIATLPLPTRVVGRRAPKTTYMNDGSATMKNIPTRSRSWRLRSRAAYVASGGRGPRVAVGAAVVGAVIGSLRSGRGSSGGLARDRRVAGQGEEGRLEAGAGDLDAGDAERARGPARRGPATPGRARWRRTTSSGGRNDDRAPAEGRADVGRGAVGHDRARARSAPCARRTRRPRRGSGWRRRWCGPGRRRRAWCPRTAGGWRRPSRRSARRGSPGRGRGPARGRTSGAAARRRSRPARGRSAISDSPARSMTAATRSLRPCVAAIARTVSSTVKSGSSPPVCITADTRPARPRVPGSAPYTSTVPRVGPGQAEQHVDGGGLARPVGPEERDDLAGLDGQVDVVDRDDRAAVGGPEGLAEAGGADGGRADGDVDHVPQPAPYVPARTGQRSRPRRDTCHPAAPIGGRACRGCSEPAKPTSVTGVSHARSLALAWLLDLNVRVGQKDASSRSIRSRSMASAMARSALIFGRLVCAKNCAAATLPS